MAVLLVSFHFELTLNLLVLWKLHLGFSLVPLLSCIHTSVTAKGPPERRLVKCALTALLRGYQLKHVRAHTVLWSGLKGRHVWADSGCESENKVKVEGGETGLFK